MVSFSSIHISATTNGHDGKLYKNSNHRVKNGARAIDISSIDGKTVEELGANDPLIIAFQTNIDVLPNIRENFGPCFLHKEGKRYSPEIERKKKLMKYHRSHIHFSISK